MDDMMYYVGISLSYDSYRRGGTDYVEMSHEQNGEASHVDVENSAWSLAQDERKYNRPINANVLNSNIGREHRVYRIR